MKESQDDTFTYKFTWIDTGREKGWVTHYQPKHLPLSSEVRGVFDILQLKEFGDCPEFDFEPCFFRSVAFQHRDDGFRDSNADEAHRWFDAHANQFSPAIKNLLTANEEIERVGLGFLLSSNPVERQSTDILRKTIGPKGAKLAPEVKSRAAMPSKFDVAISFAGSEREYARELAERVNGAGLTVFFADFYPEQLWGKDLARYFDEIYRKLARYCVPFISKEYKERMWTIHEFRSALARAVAQKGEEYILPVRVDDTDLDGLAPTLGYLPIALGIDQIADLLIKKIKRA